MIEPSVGVILTKFLKEKIEPKVKLSRGDPSILHVLKKYYSEFHLIIYLEIKTKV